jgi:YD repeat-containing protein
VETLRLPFEHGAPAGPLRLTAQTVLAPRHEAEDVEDVLVVISELVQNVTQHTNAGGTLTLTWDQHFITVEVSDASRRIPQPQPSDERRIGGRGLLLVAGIAASWGTTTHDDGKVVWARIAAPALSSPAQRHSSDLDRRSGREHSPGSLDPGRM